MKTIRKLNLHPEQEIGLVQQQFIMAGSGGPLIWTGNCFCKKKGNFHTMTASETFEYVDLTKIGVGAFAIICACATGFPLSPEALLCAGIGFAEIQSATKVGSYNYYQRFDCIGVKPLEHRSGPIISSVTL